MSPKTDDNTTQAPTRQRIVDTARELMLERGFEATAVDDICRQAGVSKGSFYHAFASKEELGLAVLQSWFDRGTERLQNGDYTELADPVDRLLGYLDHCEKYAESFWGDGCLLGNFSTELAQSHPRIRERVAEIFTRLTNSQAKLFEPALRTAGASNTPTANELSEHFLAAIEGGIVLGRAYNDPRHINAAIDQFRRYIKELLK